MVPIVLYIFDVIVMLPFILDNGTIVLYILDVIVMLPFILDNGTIVLYIFDVIVMLPFILDNGTNRAETLNQRLLPRIQFSPSPFTTRKLKF